MENYMIGHKNTRVFLQEQNTRVFCENKPSFIQEGD